MKYANFFL